MSIQPASERAQFDAWLEERKGPSREEPGYPGNRPFYWDETQSAWAGWLARAALATERSAEPAIDHIECKNCGSYYYCPSCGFTVPEIVYAPAPSATRPADGLPEPVKNGWMDCEDCNGRGSDGVQHYQGEFQPPECEPCTSCNGSGRWKVPLFTEDQMQAERANAEALRAALEACKRALMHQRLYGTDSLYNWRMVATIVEGDIEEALKENAPMTMAAEPDELIDHRLLQIRRAHASARPKPENPAWQNSHNDLGFVLAYVDAVLAKRTCSTGG